MKTSGRNPYADMGLVIAVGVFIILLVKSLLFGFSWGTIGWLCVVVAYFVLCIKFPSDSKVVKVSTTVFLLLSLFAIVLVSMFDKHTRPQMPAFLESSADTLSVEEDDLYEPVLPVELISDTAASEVVDSLSQTDTMLVSPVEHKGLTIEESDSVSMSVIENKE